MIPMRQMTLFEAGDAAPARLASEENSAGRQLTFEEVRSAQLLGMLTGMSRIQAETLMQAVDGIDELAQMPVEMLVTLPGVGVRHAGKICALCKWAELFQRNRPKEKFQVRNPADVAGLLMGEMQSLPQEEFRVVGLDTKNRVTFVEMVYRGTVNALHIRVAEVFRKAVMTNCPAIIAVHNHPSGDPTPSPEDVRVTQTIYEAGKLMDIDVIDHIVIGSSRFASMKERKLGFEG